MNFPSTLELSVGDIRLPFSDDIKYSILGLSALLLAFAIILLVWQVYRYCTQKSSSQKQANGLLSAEEKPVKEGGYGSNTQTPDSNPQDHAVNKLLEDPPRLGQDPSPEDPPRLNGGPCPGWPQEGGQAQPQGSLRFCLQYEQLQARLLVTVLGAQGLGGRGLRGGVDPQVRVLLLWAGPRATPTSPPRCCVLREWLSRVVKNSSNPTFRDQFSCSLAHSDLPHTTVRLEVRDINKHARHETLGEVRAHLGGLDLSDPLEIQEDLQPAKKDPVGEVLLSLKYLPTSQRLEVGVLKIRALSQTPSKHHALYARTSVVCNRSNLRHQKTPRKARREMTVFNEVMTFALPAPPAKQCTIAVSVFEVGVAKKSSKRLIGQASLRKGEKTEDEHWSLMMRSVRQPITKWHLLSI